MERDVFIEEKLSMGYGQMAGWRLKEEVVCSQFICLMYHSNFLRGVLKCYMKLSITIFYFLVGKLTDERIQKTFGNSKEFTKTAARILSGLSGISHCPYDLLNRVEAAQEVATCSYEYGTSWGTKVSCKYLEQQE